MSEPPHVAPTFTKRRTGTLRTARDAGRAGRLAAVVAAGLMTVTACRGPATESPGRAPAAPVAAFTLAARPTTPPLAISVSAGTGQVALRLPGDFGDVDQLVAELTREDAPDGARRWPVDPASAAADGARASVMLPAYALTPGAYSLTVWRGDADAVQRFVFRVVP